MTRAGQPQSTGKPADVEEVDNGFMAVAAEAGDNTIVFHYTTPGLHAGAALTAGGVVLFAAYMLICWKMGIQRQNGTRLLCRLSGFRRRGDPAGTDCT